MFSTQLPAIPHTQMSTFGCMCVCACACACVCVCVEQEGWGERDCRGRMAAPEGMRRKWGCLGQGFLQLSNQLVSETPGFPAIRFQVLRRGRGRIKEPGLWSLCSGAKLLLQPHTQCTTWGWHHRVSERRRVWQDSRGDHGPTCSVSTTVLNGLESAGIAWRLFWNNLQPGQKESMDSEVESNKPSGQRTNNCGQNPGPGAIASDAGVTPGQVTAFLWASGYPFVKWRDSARCLQGSSNLWSL